MDKESSDEDMEDTPEGKGDIGMEVGVYTASRADMLIMSFASRWRNPLGRPHPMNGLTTRIQRQMNARTAPTL